MTQRHQESLFFGAAGLLAKWRAMLFAVGLVVLLPVTLMPVNWLSARGLLVARADWTAGVQWAAFIAALLPSLAAAALERRPAGYGLPWKGAFGRTFWEGAAWGMAAITALMFFLKAIGSISFGNLSIEGPAALRFGAVWALAMLGAGLFEECAKRGYLQLTLAGSLGFWPTAVLLSLLFTIEKLLSSGFRTAPALANSFALGLASCLALRRTGNLWFAAGFRTALGWGAVFVYGLGISISGVPVPGALLRPAIHGPRWLTGGQSGLDASVLTLGLVALLCLVVHLRFPDQRGRLREGDRF